MASEKISILIVDDHPLFREGIKAIIAGDAKLGLAGEAGDRKEGFQMAKSLKPDLVVVDVSLPDGSGIDLVRDIREKIDGPKLLVLSMHAKVSYIVKALEAGALGYIVKESASETLLAGLHAVSRGEYFLDGKLTPQVVQRLMGNPQKDLKMGNAAYDALTPREQEIMVLLCEGCPVKEIGKKLFISPKTVENHRANIMAKLDVHSTLELVRYAVKLGLIDVELWKG